MSFSGQAGVDPDAEARWPRKGCPKERLELGRRKDGSSPPAYGGGMAMPALNFGLGASGAGKECCLSKPPVCSPGALGSEVSQSYIISCY